MAGLAEELLAQREVFLVEVGRVARGSRVAHVGELVALAVRDLVQQPRGHGAVEDEVSAVQQDLLHRLPPLDTTPLLLLLLLLTGLPSNAGLRGRGVLVGLGGVGIVVREHGPAVVIVVALALGRVGLVRLVVVGIVVGFGVHAVLAAW